MFICIYCFLTWRVYFCEQKHPVVSINLVCIDTSLSYDFEFAVLNFGISIIYLHNLILPYLRTSSSHKEWFEKEFLEHFHLAVPSMNHLAALFTREEVHFLVVVGFPAYEGPHRNCLSG